jgi:DNA-binding GntR family transcriptional regulator
VLTESFPAPVRASLDQAAAVPSRTTAVLEAIKHAILVGELVPGQPLVETELAGKLGVSKTPVREALKTLAGVGLVVMSPYKGASVRTVDDALARDVFDLRLLLEAEAVRRGVRRGGDWAAARRTLDQAARAVDTADRSMANRDFHRLMYASCGNPMLVRSLDDLRDLTALVSAAAWQRGASWAKEAAEHEEILAAAEAGDADVAARLLTEHIESFYRRNFPES